MNTSRVTAAALAAEIVTASSLREADILLCPPTAYLAAVGPIVSDSVIALGAQDCSEYEFGAYTGETAAAMLRDLGCSYVIVGHSERRQFFGDSDARVAHKVLRAQSYGLTPILCIGETLEERRRGVTEETVARQLDAVLKLPAAESVLAKLVIAYEPVWAIGTGESATPEQAQAVHAAIRQCVARVDAASAAAVRILYGGSVKAENARELFAMPDIDGGLIGGASLNATSFIAICHAAA